PWPSLPTASCWRPGRTTATCASGPWPTASWSRRSTPRRISRRRRFRNEASGGLTPPGGEKAHGVQPVGLWGSVGLEFLAQVRQHQLDQQGADPDHSIRLHRFAELRQRLALDLADALARQAEALADLLERLGLLVVQAEAHAQHRRLALVHLVEQVE